MSFKKIPNTIEELILKNKYEFENTLDTINNIKFLICIVKLIHMI
jgi:hypothetical protein